MIQATTPELRRLVAADLLAGTALALLALGALVSASEVVSAASVGVGLGLGAVPVWARRRELLVWFPMLTAAVWLVYGAAISSLPTDLASLSDWATTEGRVFVALASISIAGSFTQRRSFANLLVVTCVTVTATHAVALVFFAAGVGLPGFVIDSRGLFFGLASSHHVVAFLSACVALVVLAAPRLLPTWGRFAVLVVAAGSIVASGSRTALLGLVAGGAVILWYRVDRRQFWRSALAAVLVLALIVAASDRFRTTARAAIDPGFVTVAIDVLANGDQDTARSSAESEAEANILLRLSYWGDSLSRFSESPIIGIGVFRQNDESLDYLGRPGIFFVATSGERAHNDSEPHNVVLYLLEEVGILGLALFWAPYVVAWRRVGDRRDRDRFPTPSPHDEVVDRSTCQVLTRSLTVAAVGMSMVSSGVLATGLGIVVNMIVFGAAAVATTSPIHLADRELELV